MLTVTLKAPSISVAYKILNFSEKIKLGIWCELAQNRQFTSNAKLYFLWKKKNTLEMYLPLVF